MTTHGVATHFVDSGSGVCITRPWINLLTEWGVQHIRVTIQASAHNTLRYDLLTRAALLCRDAGISVCATLPVEMDAPWTEADVSRRVYPNENLGYDGNKRQNRFIKEFCRRAGDIAHALVPCGVTSYSIGNEQNLLGSIPIGQNVPPVAGQKAPATAPEVWASLCYEACGWLHAAGATDVALGALSYLPIGSVADIGWHDNTYGARYVRRGLAYLKETGVKSLPFSAVTTNSEGAWTLEKAVAMRSALTGAVTGAGYPDLPLRIHEWSWPAGAQLDVTKAQETAAALGAVSERLYYFQGPINPQGYGGHSWTVAGAGFVPALPRTQWWDVVRGLVAPVPATSA